MHKVSCEGGGGGGGGGGGVDPIYNVLFAGGGFWVPIVL